MLHQAKKGAKRFHNPSALMIMTIAAALAFSPVTALTQGNPDEGGISEGDGSPDGAEGRSAGGGQALAPRTIVWVLDTSQIVGEDPVAVAAKAPEMIQRIVASSKDTHVVALTPAQLGAHLARAPRPTPDCLRGLAPCANPMAVVMEALSADLLVRGELRNAGPRWSMKVTLIGANGDTALERSFSAGGVPQEGVPVGLEAGLEQLAFEAVRGLFNATGTLDILTTPDGATIFIDDKERGQSPMTVELPVGTHQIEARLDDHSPDKGIARIRAGERSRLVLDLSARLATLTVDTTPVAGEIFINNKAMGVTGSQVELPPGEYELEVRAEGFKTRTQRLILAPEETKLVSLTLEQARPQLNVASLGDIETEAIIARNYYARVAYRFTSVTTGLSEAEGTLDDQVARTGDLNNADAQGMRDFGYHGIHLDLGYNWEVLGVVGLGLSVFSSGDDAEGSLRLSDDTLQDVKFKDFTRLEVKPGQLTLRYPYKNLFPSIQTGFGYFRTRFEADAGAQGSVDMERDGFFWHFSIEASYFFDTWWYGYANLGIQRDLSHDDSDTQTLLGFGVGMTFENPLAPNDAEPPKEY